MRIAVVAASLALGACGTPVDRACDRAALDAIPAVEGNAAAAFVAACPGAPAAVRDSLEGAGLDLPGAEALWACESSFESLMSGPGGMAQALRACDRVDAIGGSQVWDTVFAPGAGEGALLATAWLQQAEYPADQARRVGAAIGAVEARVAVELPATTSPAPVGSWTQSGILGPDGFQVRHASVSEDLTTWTGDTATLLPISGTSTHALHPVIAALAGRVGQVELLGVDGEGAPRAVVLVPRSDAPGVGLAGDVAVHLHEGGILVEHGAALRVTEAVEAGALAARVEALLAEEVPGRRVRLVPHGVTVDVLMETAASLHGVPELGLSPGDSACGPAPAGMVCVDGGSDAAAGGVRLTTPFLIDVHKASLADYESCVEAGACTRTERRGSGPKLLTDLNFTEALRYCVWTGKTLPTTWQWERASSALSDGSEGPSEWTRTGSLADCGARCLGVDPIGPCDGAEECEAAPKRIVRGGAAGDGSSAPDSRAHGVRCALAYPPPSPVGRPAIPDLTPPTQEQLDLFHASPEDPIELKPLCDGVGGQAQLDCKDPVTYIIGNEPRADLFVPHIAERGGGYIGVASDQNYSQAAIAKTEWLWLMDYDPKVVSVHRMNGAFMLDSATPAEFVDWYRPGRRREAQAFIEEKLGDDELTQLALRNLRVWGDRLHEHYTREMAPPQGGEGIDGRFVPAASPDFGWLRNPAHYAHIRTLWQQGRVRAVKGDMLGNTGMQGIGKAARGMGVPIRIYYTSNAPYAWGGTMTEAYRRNVRALPMDERSILVQTLGSRSGFGQQTYWHHSIVRGNVLQERLGQPGFDHVSKIVYDRGYGGDPDLTLIGEEAR